MNKFNSVAELTSQLVQIPSVNPMGRSLDEAICYEGRVTDFLETQFSRMGLQFERYVVTPATDTAPDRENILAVLPGKASLAGVNSNARPSVLMLEVHQDTVPVDGMTIEPWSGEIRDGRVHGRGSCDIKGGMATILAAVEQLQSVPAENRPTIVVACSVNEEHGFCGATHIRELWRSGTSPILPHAPDAIIVTEPTMLDVVVAHKGCIRWTSQTNGLATHSSQPEKGRNAIYTMAKVVAALDKYATEVAPKSGEHPLLSCPTLSVGTINGGVSVNTVPDHCEIQIDHRVLPGQDPLALRQKAIEFVSSEVGDMADITFTEPSIIANGMPDDCNGDFAETLAQSARTQGHKSQLIGVQYGTDAAALAVDNIPTVVFGPGSIEQAHTKNEWVSVDQLEHATKVLVEFITQQ